MRAASRFLLLASAVAFGGVLPGQAQAPIALKVDASAGRHAIDPNIYGIVSYGLEPALARELKLPHVRWGGNGTSRYNWQVDASNSGFDWFFTGGSGVDHPKPSGSADTMVRTFKAAGAQSLITIPILPYVNRSSTWNCSFPVSIYGPQQATNPYVHPNGTDCGNSLSPVGDQLLDTNVLSNHVENSTTLQMGWVQHLIRTFGPASLGGVGFYQLDNEPGGWNNTHRDVQPQRATYATIVALGQQYAAAIKAVDPTAKVMGPSDYSLGGWIGETIEQNGLFAGQYYLRQMAAADLAQHRRRLDYFDEHYYFQFSNPAEQLASTRTLWDITYNGGTWVEQYAFNGPMQLIPRFKDWIAKGYPGTRLAFSEYSIDSGSKAITDALAEADVLGIFGREGVDFASMWNAPQATEPVAYAFRLFRNFDGAGAQFGETGVQATSTNEAQLAVFGAERSADGALTLLVLNKTDATVPSTLTLEGFSPAATAAAYRYSGADLTRIHRLPDASVAANHIKAQFPAYSATVFVFTGRVVKTPAQPLRPCVLKRMPNIRQCPHGSRIASELD